MNFYSLETSGDLNDPSFCYIAQPPEGMIRGEARMGLGKPVRKLFPENAQIRLLEEHPGIQLPGYVGNQPGYLIFSSAGRTIIQRLCPKQKIEYLSFTLINHKGRVHSTDYCIVNPLGDFDALNEVASTIRYAHDDGRILSVAKVVLDPVKLKDAPHLFRLEHKPTLYVLSQTLRNALAESNVSNIVYRPLSVQPRSAEGA